MFLKKKRVEQEKIPMQIESYPPGAVSYNGADEVYFIEIALAMSYQTYEALKKIKPKQARELEPAAEMWEKLMKKNAEYLDRVMDSLGGR